MCSGDAADRHQRQREASARLGENRQRRAHRAGLGDGTEYAAEGDVIRARLRRGLGQFNAVVAGSTEQFAWPQAPPRCGDVAVVRAQMHAVGADLQRQLDIVVDDEGAPAARHKAAQRARLLAAAMPDAAVLLRYCSDRRAAA